MLATVSPSLPFWRARDFPAPIRPSTGALGHRPVTDSRCYCRMHASGECSACSEGFAVQRVYARGHCSSVHCRRYGEAVGHGTASLLMSDPIQSLSTVAIQNASPSRFVSAVGTTANLIVGVLSLLLLRRVRKLTPSAYFLWLFGAFNLFNVGYLVASACTNSGDWAAVISGLSPSWLWRYHQSENILINQIFARELVAGAGFEPATFGL